MPPSTVHEPAPEPATALHRFDPRIVACYLYPITRYGYPPPVEGTHRYVEELAGLGFRSIELEGIHAPHLRAMHGMRDEVRRTLDRLEVAVPYYCVVLPGLASADPAVRATNLSLFELGCATARDLGAAGVLDNGPLPPYAFPGDVPVVRHYDEEVLARAGLPPSLDWAGYWRDLVATYRDACDIAARYGLTYLIHPAIGVLCANTDGFLLFRAAVDRPNLRFNLDTANQFVARDHLPLSLVRLADHVDYIHVSDNRGSKPEHLPLGSGAIDWGVFFRTLEEIGYRGAFGIDIGGSESGVVDLNRAYVEAAAFVEGRLRPGGSIP
jgi:sugar phosphate isomerase/epimerase